MMMMMKPFWSMSDRIRWDEFTAYVEAGHIKAVKVKETAIEGEFNEEGMAARVEKIGKKASKSFSVDYNPNWTGPEYTQQLEDSGIEVNFARPQLWLIMLMQWVLPLLVIVGFFYFFFARNLRGGAGGMLMSFGRSKHRLQGKDRAKVTFEDVAGVEEAKDEVAEIIEFLKNPKRFQRLGGRIPRGAYFSWARPDAERLCWPKRLRARPMCRSSAYPAAISSRCSSVSGPRESAICSSRPKRIPPASSSSTKLTRSGGNAAPAS
jgi:cell division protease FtsH